MGMEMEMEMEMEMDMDGARRRYLLALEEERRKIHVFQRELPLCLDLVTQTIEGMRRRSQIDVVVGSPVLEEFIPLKPTCLSSSSSDDDDQATAAGQQKDEINNNNNNKVMMPDWLQSVQLWSQSSLNNNKELPCKPVALNATKGGATAFHPFDKDKRAEAELPPAASSATGAASSAVVGDKAAASDTADGYEEDKGRDNNKDKEEGQSQQQQQQQQQPNGRKPRRCWAPELHRRFLQALQQLGGSHAATPKQIRELMKVEGLTNDEVKSHLQKYRLHTTRRGPVTTTAQSSAAAPPPQLVSCIWVPQAEYATATSWVATANMSNPAVYAYAPPVDTVLVPVPKPKHKSSSEDSEAVRRPSGEAVSSSSSSQTNTSA